MEITTQTIEDLSLIAPMDANSLPGISWSWLISSSLIVIVVSHIGAKYLASLSSGGYWFWFTILNLAVGLFFI